MIKTWLNIRFCIMSPFSFRVRRFVLRRAPTRRATKASVVAQRARLGPVVFERADFSPVHGGSWLASRQWPDLRCRCENNFCEKCDDAGLTAHGEEKWALLIRDVADGPQ